MNTIMRDGGEVDPYTQAVNSFLEILAERFPDESTLAQQKYEIESLRNPTYGTLYENHIKVNNLVSDLLLFSRAAEVPKRDLVLASTQHETIERLSGKLNNIAYPCQSALENAYLDAIPEDRRILISLANARDLVFESSEHQLVAASTTFLSLLEELKGTRKERGYPDWAILQVHCDKITAMTKQLENQIEIVTI